MKHYVVAEVNVKDESWVPEYRKNVTQLVHQFGGKYLARTGQVEIMEGDRSAPQLCVMLEFPSRESAQSFYESAEYAPYLNQRKAGADSNLMLIAGEDIAMQ